MKKIAIILGCAVFLVGTMVFQGMAQGGFDEYGYNYQARTFNGIGENWYRQKKGLPAWQEGDPYLYGPIFGPAHLVMRWDQLWDDARFGGSLWASGAWCTNQWRWIDPDTGKVMYDYYRFVVAPLNPPPSDDAQDVGWGHPVDENGVILCFWAILRVESRYGPYVGPARPCGPGAYKKTE